MKNFEKYLAKDYPHVRPTSDDAIFAEQNWRVALEWTLGSGGRGKIFDEDNDCYDIVLASTIEKELEE